MACFVPGCKSANKNTRARIFRPPKTADKELWLKNLPKRTDCVFDFSKSRICEKHFDPSFVRPFGPSTIIINGEVVPLPVKITYTLTHDAIPTIFPTLPKYYQKKLPIKRRCSKKFLPCIIPLKKPATITPNTTVTIPSIQSTTSVIPLQQPSSTTSATTTTSPILEISEESNMPCFVPGCKSGNSGAKAHLFKAPKTADKSLWLRNIPKREGYVFDFSKSKICDKHFVPSFIKDKTKNTIIINGEEVELPSRHLLTLTDDAVPTIFPNLPNYFQRKVPIKRRSTYKLPCTSLPLKNPATTTSNTTVTVPLKQLTTTTASTKTASVIPLKKSTDSTTNATSATSLIPNISEESNMPCCFVPGCKSGNGGAKVHLFKAPKTADKSLWLKNLPKRTDRVFDFSKSQICDKHFVPAFIKNKSKNTIIINGEEVQLPIRQTLTLTDDAVPTIFPELPNYFQRKVPIKRRSTYKLPCTSLPLKNPATTTSNTTVTVPLKQSTTTTTTTSIVPLKKSTGSTNATTSSTTSLIPKISTTTTTQNDEFNDFNNSTSSEIESPETELLRIFKELHNLPTGWCLPAVKKNSFQFIIPEIVIVNNIPAIRKYIEIKTDKSLRVKIIGHVHNDITHHVGNAMFSNAQDIVSVIEKVDKLNLCPGIDDFEEINLIRNGTLINGLWYSESCKIITNNAKDEMCEKCRILLRCLRVHRYNASKTVAPKENVTYLDDSMIQIELHNDDSTVKYIDYK